MNAIRLSSATARRPVPVFEHNRVALRAFTALCEICNGTARREEWQDLADSCNIVEALSVMGKYERVLVEPVVDMAIHGLMVAIKCPDGMMRMGAAATLAMRHVVTLHDEAIGKFGRVTMFEANALVLKRIADPTAGESTGLFVVNA